MPTFQYSAKNRQGVLTHGTVEAVSNAVAVKQLQDQGLWVTGLQPLGGPAPAVDREVLPLDAWWTGVSLKDLAIYFRQFATMINAGMPLGRCLSLLEQQSGSARLRQVTGDLIAQVQTGGPLAAAFRRHPAVFRPLTVAMIEAGEVGGFLDRMLYRIAEYLEREHEIRQQLKSRTLYPKILIGAGILIPKAPILVLQGPAAYLSAILGTVLVPVVCLVGVWVAVRFLLQYAGFRAFYDSVKLAIPLVGSMARQGAVGKLFRGLAALYGAGVPVARGMRLAAGACDNWVISQAVLRQTPRVERGEPMSMALESTRLLPPMAISMVRTGEESGDMESMLGKVADYQEREAEHRMKQMTVVLPVAAYLVVAILLGLQIIEQYRGYATGLLEIGSEQAFIRDMDQTHYQILGIEPTASAEQIKRRFRELARVHHPDVNRDKSGSHQQFVRITEAYQVLSDATRRADYDLMLRDRAQRRGATTERRTPNAGGTSRSASPSAGRARPGPNPPPPHVGFRPPPSDRRPPEGSRPRAATAGGRSATVGGRASAPGAATRVADAAQLLREAQVAFAGLRYRDAIRLCKAVLDLDRRNASACGLLGDIYRAQGRVDDAIYFYSLAAQLSPAPQNRVVMAKLEALLTSERGVRPGASASARSPEATLADGAARVRRRASRQVCVGAFGLALAVLLLLGSAQVRADPLTELPWIAGWTAPLVWGMVLSGAAIGATLALAGAVRPLDEELFFTPAGPAGGSTPPLGLLLFLIGGLFFYLAVGIYLLIGALQESFSRSLMRVFVATFLVICCLALMLTPEVGRQILLFGGNVVFLSMLVGWLLGDFFRPLGV